MQFLRAGGNSIIQFVYIAGKFFNSRRYVVGGDFGAAAGTFAVKLGILSPQFGHLSTFSKFTRMADEPVGYPHSAQNFVRPFILLPQFTQKLRFSHFYLPIFIANIRHLSPPLFSSFVLGIYLLLKCSHSDAAEEFRFFIYHNQYLSKVQ